MEYRRFGRTELQMPILSCGGMRYQQAWQDCPMGEIAQDGQKNLEATIRRSLELGINHIETARAYGTSEMQLGQILPTLPRDEMIVQTKVETTPDPDEFLKRFETSMEYLKLDRVDLLGMHGINNQERLDDVVKPGGCLEVARKLQKQGRVGFVGFSTHGSCEIITKAIETDEFDYVNLHWYYIFQNNWPAVEAATKRDMGVFIISPSDKGGMLYDPPKKLVDLCQPLSPMAFNDLFCLSRPEVHTISIGAARPTDFDEHIKALTYLDRAGETIAPIIVRLDQVMVETMGQDWVDHWQTSLKYNDTPHGVNIWVMLFLRNLVLSYDMVKYGKMRFNLFGEGEHWFPGDKIESKDQLKAIDFSCALTGNPFAEKIPDYLCETFDMLHGQQVKRLSQS